MIIHLGLFISTSNKSYLVLSYHYIFIKKAAEALPRERRGIGRGSQQSLYPAD